MCRRVAAQQLSANDEHETGGREQRIRMRTQVACRVPRVNGRDVLEVSGAQRRIQRSGDITGDVPELPEIAASLIGRVAVPEQLPAHLEVEPHHVGLDESHVRLQ